VLLIGDSHAAQLNIFADIVGRKEGIRFKILTASACVPISKFDVERLPDYSREECTRQIENVKSVIDNYHNVILAGMWSWQMPSEKFAAGLNDFLRQQDESGKKVMILAQVPMFEFDVMRVHRFNYLGLNIGMTIKKDWIGVNDEVYEISRKYKNIDFMDFSSAELFRKAPLLNGGFIYSDSHHLNENGSRLYGAVAGDCIKKWLINEKCAEIR